MRLTTIPVSHWLSLASLLVQFHPASTVLLFPHWPCWPRPQLAHLAPPLLAPLCSDLKALGGEGRCLVTKGPSLRRGLRRVPLIRVLSWSHV